SFIEVASVAHPGASRGAVNLGLYRAGEGTLLRVEALERALQPLAHSTEEDPRVALLARAALFEPAVAEVPGTEEVFEGAVSRRAAAGDVLAGVGEQLGAEIGEAFGAADRGIDLGAGRPEHLRHDGGDADDHEVAERADDDGGGD